MSQPLESASPTEAWWRGRRLAYFGGCDYFRLASHPRVVAAAKRAADRFGLGVAASRVTTGNHPLYGELEAALARFFGTERALVTTTGYIANTVVAQGLAGEFTHVLLDEATHPSLQDAAPLFQARTVRFRAGDAADLARRHRALPDNARSIVLTDGVCSATGRVAPLAGYRHAVGRQAWMLVDDCHGVGTVGQSGRGSPELTGVTRERLIQTGTLSKAFGAYGGIILATGGMIDRFTAHSRSFAGSTPPPLPLAAAALESLKLLQSRPALRRRLATNVEFLKSALLAAGRLEQMSAGPICLVVPRDAGDRLRLHRRLLRHGVFPSFLNYPCLPLGGAFRFGISSEHTRAQLTALTAALTDG